MWLNGSGNLPTFSPDGKYIISVQQSVKLPEDIKNLKYSLCRTDFNESNGKIGQKVDTLLNANIESVPGTCNKRSVCHPRVSPDGKRILYTVADYRNIPITTEADADDEYQDGADRHLGDSQFQSFRHLPVGRQTVAGFVFASKRDDGLYGKPYFQLHNREKDSQPFVLPQSSPISMIWTSNHSISRTQQG